MTPPTVLEDLLPLLGRGRVVLVGEIPGTRQFPELIADLAIVLAAESQATVVGLEVPFNEPLDGERWGDFWTRDARLADGRSSQAMAELVITLADLAAAGHPVHVAGLDGAWVAPGSTIDLAALTDLERRRDDAMAGHFLAAMDAHPGAAGIVLAGADHTGVTPGSGTMGSIIVPWFPGSVALVGLATGGSALVLGEDGPQVGAVSADPGVGIGAVWSDQPGADGHHGFVNLGTVSPAQPFGS